MEYILWETTWLNLMLLLATIPTYEEDKEEQKKEVAPDQEVERIKKMLGH